MEVKGYGLIRKEYISEIDSYGYYYRHEKSGARVCVVSNDDTNKVFSIAFRTPVYNDTGVPHILEHSVLCGSEKYPIKDPFVELAKGSLNTFLNAMTYNDKTVYPVASCNDKDFKNLVSVYLDSVFRPNIYKHEEIFRQEGWSCKMEDIDGPLKYNGVVYNEMKGAFSNPESVVWREIMHGMYPDTTYGYESGGNPDNIPDLKYSEFLDFHSKYYHPVNSYIYLYGNMDIEEYLRRIDEEYLSGYDKIELDSEIKWQEMFDEQKELETEYPIAENESEEGKAFLTYSSLLGDILDMNEYRAFDIIEYALLQAPGAILKQNILDSGIARGVDGGSVMNIRQPYFSIVAKEADIDRKAEFIDIVEKTLEKVVKEGFDKGTLTAGINSLEFRTREADFGGTPKGLVFGLNMLDTWLYDDDMPFEVLKYNKVFEFLKAGVENGYFEKLVEKYLIGNSHTVKLYARPVKGLAAKKDEELKNKLEEYKNSLSEQEKNDIVRKTKELVMYQDAEDSEEMLNKIPLLEVSDINKNAEPYVNELREEYGTKVLYHDVFTNKIVYFDLLFNTDNVADDDIKYLGLLQSVFAYMNTQKHTYFELGNMINTDMGGFGSEFMTCCGNEDSGKYKTFYKVWGKMLYDKIPKAVDIVKEVLYESVFTDEKRLKEILGEIRLRLENRFLSSGHAESINRSLSYFTESYKIINMTSGIDFYRFICDVDDNYETGKNELIAALTRIFEEIKSKNNVLLSVTCDNEGYEMFIKEYERIAAAFKSEPEKGRYERKLDLSKKNEGFKTSSQVQYVVKSGNYSSAGYKYTGVLNVFANIMNYDYLWNNIRVKGGAYGCGVSVPVNGNMAFYSYRDPNLKNTLRIYDDVVEYLENFDATKREMTGYIIGAISSLDTPLTPNGKGYRSLMAYLNDMSYESLNRWRSEVLNADVAKIRALAKPVAEVLSQNYICTIGSEVTIGENQEVFLSVEGLK